MLYLVIITIQADRVGTARAQMIPISSYSPSSAWPWSWTPWPWWWGWWTVLLVLAGKRAGGLERIMTPVRRIRAIKHLHTPQWSFNIMQESTCQDDI